MRRALVAGLVGVVVAGGGLAGSAAAAAGAGPGAAAGRRVVPAPAGRGFFRSHCTYSHTASDDPILMPGMAGQSMVHDFFGNTTTSAASTATGLLAAGTTSCAAPADTSAYWVPALYQHGMRVAPTQMSIYYRAAGRSASSIATLPQGLQMIAGNEAAMEPQSTSVAYWSCGAKAGIPKSALPPASCPGGADLVLSLNFPDCWDGHTLAGASQKNVAYAAGNACPHGYPVAIPQLSVHVRYPISHGDGLTLSMGPTANEMPSSIDTAHADVINAWTPAVLASLVERCDAASLRCGTVGPANEPLGISPRELRRARVTDRRSRAGAEKRRRRTMAERTARRHVRPR